MEDYVHNYGLDCNYETNHNYGLDHNYGTDRNYGMEHNYGLDKPRSDLPRRRIARSLAEFSNDSFAENCGDKSCDKSREKSCDSCDETLMSGKTSPRLHMKPVHTLALILLLTVALCASLTMLISQSLTYQRMQHTQAEAWQSASDNPAYSTSSSKKLRNKRAHNSKNIDEDNQSQEDANIDDNSENTIDANNTVSDSNSDGSYSVEHQDGTTHNDHGVTTTKQAKSPLTGTAMRKAQQGAVISRENAGRININTATLAQLQTLKGVGPKTAARILAQRKRVGRFHSLEDLLQIKGIGPKTLNKFRGVLDVG